MATLMYDGRPYAIVDSDVTAVLAFARQLAAGTGDWLSIGLEGGGQAQLWIGPGTSIAIHTEAVLDS
jgi:hypothetical protein